MLIIDMYTFTNGNVGYAHRSQQFTLFKLPYGKPYMVIQALGLSHVNMARKCQK